MLVYLTKPLVHECIMGGFRSVKLWTKAPHYHHYPTRINSMQDGIHQYVDKGWTDNNWKNSCPAKPLIKQDEILAEKVWNYITWSCCPKGISFEEHINWCNEPLSKYETNWESMLFGHKNGTLADINCNINYKRFLLEVNIRTNEVKIITPFVHWYNSHDEDLFAHCDKTEETQDIDERFATEIPYALHKDSEFNQDLPF